MYEEVIERFLEVKATQSREVVAVIKILSPKNKRSKEGRTVYENKRQKILASATNLVEIDLLRLGESLPIIGVTKSDYSTFQCNKVQYGRARCPPHKSFMIMICTS